MFNNSDTILRGMRVGDVWLYHMGIMPQLNRKHFTVTALELCGGLWHSSTLDLSVCDYYLWGMLKDRFCVNSTTFEKWRTVFKGKLPIFQNKLFVVHWEIFWRVQDAHISLMSAGWDFPVKWSELNYRRQWDSKFPAASYMIMLHWHLHSVIKSTLCRIWYYVFAMIAAWRVHKSLSHYDNFCFVDISTVLF